MTPEQKAAYIMAQTACAIAEIESMKAANWMREDQGYTIAYGEEAFAAIPDKYGIHHNAVCAFMIDFNAQKATP